MCQVCGGEFVYPAEWQEVDETHQWVRLRCGACETWREDVFSDEALDRFDRRLDEAAELMADEADRLHWAWRAAEADTFAAALHRNLIDAGDFAR